jgi:membrane-associated phospholipid phosphatase
MLLEDDASQPPAQPPQLERPTISRLVPNDPFFWVRMTAIAVYAVLYIRRFKTDGLIIDRISVAISVGIFLLCAFAGKPWRRWAILVIDAVLYALMWYCYEVTRDAAATLGLPLQVQAPRNIDRALFFGYDPNVWMQQHFYHANDIRWYDNVASCMYYTHFIFPVIALAVVWAVSRVQWVRFMKRFASLLAAACVMFVLMPTVPPWMASSTDKRYHYRLFPPLARHTGRGFSDLGFHGFVKDWGSALKWGNAVAAMPSLHASFALFVPAFFLPMIKPIWLKALVLVFPIMMLTSLVYFGEHWVIDGLVGWALVGASFMFWNWFEGRQRNQRAGRARQALGAVS